MKLFDSLRALVPHPARSPRPGRAETDDTEPAAWRTARLHALLVATLSQAHLHGQVVGSEVVLDSGIRLQAEFIEAVQLGEAHFKTFSRIHAVHPQAFPEPLFEFQHAAGPSVEASLADGFATWVKTDLLTLQDALREDPQHCTVVDLPPTESPPGQRRQVLLGPVGHLVAHPDRKAAGAGPFDPGGLFQACRGAFVELLRSDRFLGIRLFASRDARGMAGADCRVNGEPFAPGAECLQQDVQHWPEQGLEFRKQYVVVRTLS